MAANNVMMIVGHVGKDPEMRYLDSGTALTKFRVAVKRPVKDSSGIDTDWFECVFWGKQAETAASLVKKGALVSIVGAGRIEQWGSGDEKKSKFSIKAENFQLLSPKKQDGAAESSTKESDLPPSLDLEEDDIPEEDAPF